MADQYSYGIDVSHNNGTVDWPKVESASPATSFVFIKATEGVGYTDPMCQANAQAVSQQTRMRFGYYHFASLNNSTDVKKDATDEANWFVQVMQSLPEASLLPVLDIERNDAGLTPSQVVEWITAFFEQMDVLGFPKVMLYSYVSFLNENLPADHPFGSSPLWIAHYTSAASPTIPHGWTSYMIWQYSGSGSMSGVSTQCDLDKSTPRALQQLRAIQRPSRSHSRPNRQPQPPNAAPAAPTVTAVTNQPATETTTSSAADDPGRKHLVAVKEEENDRFIFFGLKLGSWFFLGLMYRRPSTKN